MAGLIITSDPTTAVTDGSAGTIAVPYDDGARTAATASPTFLINHSALVNSINVVYVAQWIETVTSITGSLGNVYRLQRTVNNGNARLTIYHATVTVAGIETITINKSAADNCEVAVANVTGSSGVDVHNSATGSNTTPTVSCTSTVSGGLFGSTTDGGSSTSYSNEATEAQGNTLLYENPDRAAGMPQHLHWRAVSSGANASTWGIPNSSAWVAGCIALKE